MSDDIFITPHLLVLYVYQFISCCIACTYLQRIFFQGNEVYAMGAC